MLKTSNDIAPENVPVVPVIPPVEVIEVVSTPPNATLPALPEKTNGQMSL